MSAFTTNSTQRRLSFGDSNRLQKIQHELCSTKTVALALVGVKDIVSFHVPAFKPSCISPSSDVVAQLRDIPVDLSCYLIKQGGARLSTTIFGTR
jgi:hypothetical protein